MKPQHLERAFAAYFEEIDRCARSKCFWALAHLLLILPDICASLETSDGEVTGELYTRWCKRYLRDDRPLSPGDMWPIRCALLHQGRTLPKRGSYGSVSFVQPSESGTVFHQIVHDFGAGIKPNITLDVSEIAKDITDAMRLWFADLQKKENAVRAANVKRHLPLLAKQGRKEIPGVAGINIQTMSSTGSDTRLHVDNPREPKGK
jgi:hypothetical protein